LNWLTNENETSGKRVLINERHVRAYGKHVFWNVGALCGANVDARVALTWKKECKTGLLLGAELGYILELNFV